MDTLISARALMGISLGFHIIYAAVGVGLPLLLLVAEGLALRRRDDSYHQLARRWARTAAVLFAVGAVSGTILSFELGLLWPEFMRFAGGIIGMPFSLEGFAFFTEAIFLALYLYGERRLSRRAQFIVTFPILVSAALSAVFVISANAWMNTPAGFRLVDGQVTDVRPFAAMFNPAMRHEAIHGTLASYVATSFAVAGIYAFMRLRGDQSPITRHGLNIGLATGTAVLPLMLISGDLSARFVAERQPEKFAAMEGIFETTAGAPLRIGGWPDPETGEIRYSIQIPKLLSFLGYGDPNATVRGLNDFPPDTTPDPRRLHLSFDLMVGSFFLLCGAVAFYGLDRWRNRGREPGRWPLRAVVAAGPFGFIALQSGWMVTEFGRQPWVVKGYLRVSEGVTTRAAITPIFVLFLLVYVALTAGLLWLLFRGPSLFGRRRPREEAGHAHS